jgi:hypothetical protein
MLVDEMADPWGALGGRDQARFRLIPKSRIVEVPNGNHYLFLANHAIVLAELGAFLGALAR